MPKRKKQFKEKEKIEEISKGLSEETKRGIGIVILFVIAFIVLLSIFDLAGPLGKNLLEGLKIFFGWGYWLPPIILIILGYVLINQKKYQVKVGNIIGLFLFVLSYSAILHLFVPLEEMVSSLTQGQGGGYFGLFLAYPFEKILSLSGAIIVLIALFIISLLLMFDTSLETILNKLRIGFLIYKIKRFFNRFKREEEKTFEEVGFKEKQIPESRAPKYQALGIKSEEIEKKKEEIGQTELFPEIKRKLPKIDLPIDLLNGKIGKPTSGDIRINQEIIKKTLANFGIEVEMGKVSIGPTVTQYTLRPKEGIKLAQITSLSNDLALALASHPIRIEAPIPGKSLVGIEVPNQQVAIVSLKEVLTSREFKERKSKLTIALGKDVAGKSWLADLGRMPHLLIAGSTGSGKTCMINSIIISLLYQNQPDELKFILVDPKRVELPLYNGIPHLLTPVITDAHKTINALRWTVKEMDRRFHLLSETQKRDIEMYNLKAEIEKIPYVVVIIDELADLMAVAAAEVEAAIIRLAQMARAVGIHLIVATQRPSVDIITGLIKANITSRIAFSVASLIDSRTILDYGGAEKLLGRGDLLFVSPEISKPKRLQGAFVSDEEIERVVDFLKKKGAPDYQEEILKKEIPKEEEEEWELKDDDLLPEARDLVIRVGKASASYLQRRLRIGYARAARLLDLLEEEGIIGPADGAKPREVLVKRESDIDSESETSSEENEEENI